MNVILQSALAAILGSGLSLVVLTWLLKTWISSRIDSSIGHEYEKRLSEYENKIEMRTRAQLVAELLAEWMDSSPDESMSSDQRKRINRLSFEATLWLPDEIAKKLSQVLQSSASAPNQFELLLDVRKYLSGPHKLTTKEITYWSRWKEHPNYGLPEGCSHGEVRVFGLTEKLAAGETEIGEEALIQGFIPKTGSKVCLRVKSLNSEVRVDTDRIEFVKLVSKTSSEDSPEELCIMIKPKSLADDINRSLFEDN